MEAALAKRLVAGLKQAGIDLVAYLPETRLSHILPLLLVVAYLGSMNDQRNNSVYAVSGTYVEPLLDALQIKTQILVNGDRLEADIQDAVRHMHALKLPVALVFTGDFTR